MIEAMDQQRHAVAALCQSTGALRLAAFGSAVRDDFDPEHSDLDVVRQRVAWGPGPRASQAFMLACRARAIIQGRLAPSVDDVVALAGPILRHRMAVNFSARAEGVTVESVIAQMCARLG